jgi:hypothetical protein
VITHHHASVFSQSRGGRVLVQELEAFKLSFAQPMGRVRNVLAHDLLVSRQLSALGTHHDGLHNLEPRVSVLALGFNELRIVVVRVSWGAQGNQGCVFHLQNGQDGLVKEFGCNVSSLVQNNEISSRPTSSLKRRGGKEEGKNREYMLDHKINWERGAHQEGATLLAGTLVKGAGVPINGIRVQ